MSQWRLHRDSSLATAGRYWFCPPGTPFYPEPHLLGSVEWRDADDRIFDLGEIPDSAQWSNGLPPRPMPLPVRVGSADCLQFGEANSTPVPIPSNSICKCYPLLCYGIVPTGIFDITCCETQSLFASFLLALYIDPDEAALMIQNYLGPTWTLSISPQVVDNVPATIVAVNPANVVLCFITGTTTPQQWALQGLYATVGLENFGPYSTYGLWQSNRTTIINRIDAALTGDASEIYVIGHSMGGAIAQLIAATLSAVASRVPVDVLTYGMPTVGDDRVNELVASQRTVHIRGVDDPVPGLPPYDADLISLYSVVTGLQRTKYETLAPARKQFNLYADGSVTEDDGQQIQFGLLRTLTALIQAAMDTPKFNEHLINTYYQRLAISCPAFQPPWVFPDPVRVILTGIVIHDGVNLQAVDLDVSAFWDGVSGYTTAGHVGPVGAGFSYGVSMVPQFAHTANVVPAGILLNVSINPDVPPLPIASWTMTWIIPVYTYWTPDIVNVLLPPSTARHLTIAPFTSPLVYPDRAAMGTMSVSHP